MHSIALGSPDNDDIKASTEKHGEVSHDGAEHVTDVVKQ